MQVDWELAQSLVSDGQGFRCACSLPPNADQASYRIVAGTQGGSLWEFEIPSGNMVAIPYQHNHAVTAMINLNDKVYVTGCKDSVVRVFDSRNHELKFRLDGHEKAVTSLSSVSSSSEIFLVTGSWDGTAKVWNMTNRSLVATLQGHENTVSVFGLPSTDGKVLRIATGSAGIAQNNSISNHSIRIWEVDPSTGQTALVNKVSNDHDGPIRDLCTTKSGTLASCSNDGTVKLRSVENGQSISTLVFPSQDPPMLLSVNPLGDGVMASAEDGNVILWTGEDSVSVRHAVCVWSALPLPENDFATCCQDGYLRVFTQSRERMAPQEVRDEFQKSVSEALQKQRKGPSQEEVSKLPMWENNTNHQGRSEGQIQLFQKAGVAIAAQWSMVSQTWIEVGEVVGSNEDSGMIDGVRYDHVFPIEVDQSGGGVAKLQVGYNTGENPFVAAQRFIDAHVLPQYHLAEIADYIKQRVGNAAPTIGMDTPMPSAPAVVYEHLPMKGYKSFELSKAVNFEKMQAKLKEANRLSDADFTVFNSLAQTLQATSRYHSTKVEPAGLRLIETMISGWPAALVFPALDLARLVVLHPNASKEGTNNYWSKILSLAFSQCDKVTDADGAAANNVPMLTLRLVCNCFRGGRGSIDAVSTVLDEVMGLSERYIQSNSKHVRLSVATVLLNVSSFLMVEPTAMNVSALVVSQVHEIIKSRKFDIEPIVRALVALGTVLLARDDAKQTAHSLSMITKVEMFASPHGDKAKAVAKEIYTILSS